ncbi:MAG: type II secretion system protein [Chloroflexi bacterium]|nr:type II secretion system protein [Chloroflexota bacterium]
MKKIVEIGRGQRGFTLIELLAVMAILATLVAIVAPAVAGSREASIQAQAQQDATQVRTAASKYFSSKNESEVRTTHTVATTTKLPPGSGATADTTVPAPVDDAKQFVSNGWPEKFITLGQNPPADVAAIGARYSDVFQTSLTPAVDTVILLDATSLTLKGEDFLERFTAVDIDTLVTEGFLAKKPVGVDVMSMGKPNFLWLLSKMSSGSEAQRKDDSRDVAVFKLVKVDLIEGTTNLKLIYQQVLGSSS